MILYVNGDSHSAGAEAVVPYAFAEDDSKFWRLGRRPHPENLKASYGNVLASKLNATFVCDAESASSNTRILRTAREYLANTHPDIVVIGWSTWERQEWLHNNMYYQVNASGADIVPGELKEKYKKYIAELNWEHAILQNHHDIYQFHCELTERNIRHLFFNCYSSFSSLNNNQYNWNNCYIDPYDPDMTYWKWLTDRGFVSNQWYHFDADAHKEWADFLFSRLT